MTARQPTKVAVITIVSGRHDHLFRQHDGIAASERPAQDQIVVAMSDPELANWHPAAAPSPHIVDISADPGRLPLARARNRGARTAIDRGADLLIFLDVDCIPSPTLIGSYCSAAAEAPELLFSGPVGYLTAPPPGGYKLDTLDPMASFHDFRPRPPAGALVRGGDHALFWSLSFAATASTWNTIGGFDEAYEGYGAEDTDFGFRARDRGVDLAWVGGAIAYHQHHETSSPPVQHLDDILANGAIFAERWGFWPMRGWLDGFEAQGLIRKDAAAGYSKVGPA
jgi:GT2 family glycosyltransferase